MESSNGGEGSVGVSVVMSFFAPALRLITRVGVFSSLVRSPVAGNTSRVVARDLSFSSLNSLTWSIDRGKSEAREGDRSLWEPPLSRPRSSLALQGAVSLVLLFGVEDISTVMPVTQRHFYRKLNHTIIDVVLCISLETASS